MTYSVVVLERPTDQIGFLRLLRLVGALELREAKSIEEYVLANLPCPLVDGVEQATADRVAAAIRDVGGAASVQKSATVHAMLVWPAAAIEREWRFWTGPTKKEPT